MAFMMLAVLHEKALYIPPLCDMDFSRVKKIFAIISKEPA